MIQLFKESLEKAGTEFLKENKEDHDCTLPTFQSAYYQVSRFLSNSEVPAGQMFLAFLEEFKNKFDSVETSVNKVKEIQTMLKASIDAVNEVVSLSVSQFSRLSVEKYVYAKLFPFVKDVYMCKKATACAALLEKREKYREKSDVELMKILEIKEKFCIGGGQKPYLMAIEALNGLEKHASPVDKLNCILESTTHMKTTVIDYWKGKEELETMDDQLPVIIFIVFRVGISTFPAQIEFLLDYTRINNGMDNEHRLLINYDAAVSFIMSDM